MDIENLKALAEAATPGPWVKSAPGEVSTADYVADGETMCDHISSGFGCGGSDPDDAAFVAAANPAAVLELIAEIERLRADLSERAANAWRVIDAKGKRFTIYHEGFAQAIAELGLAVTPMCDLPPAGWECSRNPGHEGPCAASELTS